MGHSIIITSWIRHGDQTNEQTPPDVLLNEKEDECTPRKDKVVGFVSLGCPDG